MGRRLRSLGNGLGLLHLTIKVFGTDIFILDKGLVSKLNVYGYHMDVVGLFPTIRKVNGTICDNV
jgi:hypothetical protein